jgi:hypothetical protein
MTPEEIFERKRAEDDRHRPTPPTPRQQRLIDILAQLSNAELDWLDKELTVTRFERTLKKK